MKKTCIVIVGPTAVGKTSFAIRLAQSLHAEIISADSRQCFRELNIGVAKPSLEELALVPHHFISSHSIFEEVNAGAFERYALEKLGEFFSESDVAVVVGGTGLYIKALTSGMDAIPETPVSLREEIKQAYSTFGMDWLHNELNKYDPAYLVQQEKHNSQRLMRALEVIKHTGKSISSYQTNEVAKRDFEIMTIGLELPRPELYARINQRVEVMMQDWLWE